MDVKPPEFVRQLRLTTPLVVLSAMFVLAGGLIHLREWLETYRQIPADVPGAALVRIGFPLNAAASLILAVAIVLVFRRRSRFTQPVIVVTIGFQAASLAVLVATRLGSVLGWSEPSWTPGAQQTLAVEAAAIAGLLALAALAHRTRTGGDWDVQGRDRDGRETADVRDRRATAARVAG